MKKKCDREETSDLRRQTDEALKEIEERYRALFDLSLIHI